MKNTDIKKLIQWYDQNKRSLPWRDTGNPYDVWLSEIMLQQTRIEAVKPKYIAFKNELPDIASLANCDDDRLMRLWEGLGYYSRARNLKKCAIFLMEYYDGKLPKDFELLKILPGIGPYTAGAIASIAYNLPAPAIDGNVLRVLTRYYGITEDIRLPKVKETIEEKNLTALMITHNLSDAIHFGNRLIVMHRGEIARDFATEEKAALTEEELFRLMNSLDAADLQGE